MKRALVMIAFGAMLIFPTSALAHHRRARAAVAPQQGVYEECEPVNLANCEFRLAMASNAGFNVVLNYSAWYGSLQQVTDYMDFAKQLGIQLIWPFDAQSFRNDPASVGPFISLVNGCTCTWGYYVGDEVPVADQYQVAEIAGHVRADAPGKHLLFVADSPTGDSAELEAFHQDAGWLGGDVYPIGTSEPLSMIETVAKSVHDVAADYNKNGVVVVQAFAWSEYNGGTYVFPTEQQMAQEKSYALAGDPSLDLLMWYSEYDIVRSADPQGNWTALTSAAF